MKVISGNCTRQNYEKSPVAAQNSSTIPHLQEKLELNIENETSQLDQLKVHFFVL